jgi:L-2,4-diaminobutyric acid acetyltransferase
VSPRAGEKPAVLNTLTQAIKYCPESKSSESSLSESIVLRRPVASNGPLVHRVIASYPPLDENSRYCNLLQCIHFAGTSVAADGGGTLKGFVSGHLLPDEDDMRFVWQVAVAEAARGHELRLPMLRALLERPATRQLRHFETRITPDNARLWRMNHTIAETLDAPLTRRPWRSRKPHLANCRVDQLLVRIGPFHHRRVTGRAHEVERDPVSGMTNVQVAAGRVTRSGGCASAVRESARSPCRWSRVRPGVQSRAPRGACR